MELNIKDYLNLPILIIILFVLISLVFIFPVLNMVVLGAILAYGIKPVAIKIQSKLKYSSISILIAMVAVLIPLILLLSYIIFEVSVFVSWVLANNSNTDVAGFFSQIKMYLPAGFDINAVNSYVDSAIKNVGSYILNYIVKLAGKLANLTLDLFILVCSVFYFIRDGENCLEFIKSFVPDESKKFFDNTIKSIENVLKSIFYGHFLTSVLIGIFGCIGYSLLGYPFGIFLGVLTGILQLIPVFGPWPIYWALFFIDIASGNYVRAVIVLLFGFFLSTVDMYIRPNLSSHYADIHPLILLIGFLAGPLVYGIVGFVVGPLILGITYAVLDSYRKEYILGDD
ncbi:MAG: AI-2E family transporter [Methanobrevibacter sp.]|uniref:AI-2E family transporter n=1 Tax=uncultured Methanobrevibacter sp. TaxID=253161 RepID=UPI0025FBF8A7|nr:AI-2E family transporter [uncultured Methanobrevibacter sp.]MEE1129828.1 AI-2E family transporter [Methanobrevibacter sp.]